MKIVAESLLHTGNRDKVMRADEAVRLIRDGDSVVGKGVVLGALPVRPVSE